MPNRDEILTQVCKLLKPFAKVDQTINEESELVADLGLDSIQVMELLFEIEEQFDMSIPLNILPDVRTVRDLAAQLEKMAEQTS